MRERVFAENITVGCAVSGTIRDHQQAKEQKCARSCPHGPNRLQFCTPLHTLALVRNEQEKLSKSVSSLLKFIHKFDCIDFKNC